MSPIDEALPKVLRNVLYPPRGVDYPGLGELTPSLLEEAAKLTARFGDKAHHQALCDLPDSLRSEKFDEMIATPWPERKSRTALLDGCVEMLLEPCEHRLLAWAVMQEQLHRRAFGVEAEPAAKCREWGWSEYPFPLSGGNRRALQAECLRVLVEDRSEDSRERSMATCLLVAQELGGAKVDRSVYTKLLRDDDPGVWEWATVGMIRFGEREFLVENLRSRPRTDWMQAIWILRNGLNGSPGKTEQAFWLATAKANPGPMASLLEIQARVNPASIPESMHEVVLDFLLQEIEVEGPAPGVQRQQQIVDALFVLNHWNNPDDTELLRRHLAYRHPLVARQQDENGAEIEVKDYPVRVQAANMLLARGEPAADGVVFRENSPAPRS